MSFRNSIVSLLEIECRYFGDNYSERRDERSKEDDDDNIVHKIKVDTFIFYGICEI